MWVRIRHSCGGVSGSNRYPCRTHSARGVVADSGEKGETSQRSKCGDTVRRFATALVGNPTEETQAISFWESDRAAAKPVIGDTATPFFTQGQHVAWQWRTTEIAPTSFKFRKDREGLGEVEVAVPACLS